MSTKLILTSALALAIASPAFATLTQQQTFPVDGTMWENTVYQNQAVEQNLGVTEGTVTAEAYYTWNTYTFNPGTYWPMGSEYETVPASYLSDHPGTTWAQYITCPANSYCPGTMSYEDPWHYDVSNDQGLHSCPMNYTASDAGSVVIADCYDTSNSTPAPGMSGPTVINGCILPEFAASGATMTGRNYYGWGDDTCDIAVTGQTSNTDAMCRDGYTYVPSRDLYTILTANGVSAGAGTAPNTVEYTTTVNKDVVTASGSGSSTTYTTTQTQQTLNLGSLTYQAVCSEAPTNKINVGTQQSPMYKYAEVTSSANGQYCYCQASYFTGGTGLSEYLSTTSLFDHFTDMSESAPRLVQTFQDAQACSTGCASACGTLFASNVSTPMGDQIVAGSFLADMRDQPTCEAKPITITWRGATPNAIAANNAGATWYSKDVTTPYTAAELPGKTFSGWRFLSKNGEYDTATPVTIDSQNETVDMNGNIINTYMGNTTTQMPYDGPMPTDTPSNP